MSFKNVLIPLFAWLVIAACTKPLKTNAQSFPDARPHVKGEVLEQHFMEWWTYYRRHIVLSADFAALDAASKPITKQAFLEELKTGSYIPLKLGSEKDTTYLKLHRLSPTADADIIGTMQNEAAFSLEKYQMEGVAFADFHFTSLAGETFETSNTQDKIIVLKCWFIACKACVAEFPELNELVDAYQDRTDIEFISLAYDDEKALKSFMQKKEFKYAVASVDRDFLENELGVRQYPTHIIIDKKGRIRKVINSVAELKMELHRLL